jgi:RHS repeat-associated protein
MPSQGSPPARKAGQAWTFTYEGTTSTLARVVRGSTTTTYAATPQAPLGERTGSSLLLYLRDLHGDILGLVQAGASTPSSRAYQDPWGGPSWSGTAPLLGFRSQFTDPATGAVATPARWYLPSLSRFSSPDPLPGDPTLPLSLNRYAYAADDPITLSDPTGLRPSCEDCTPEEYEEVVGGWAQAQVKAASSGTGAYAQDRTRDPARPPVRPPWLPVRSLPFSVTLDEVSTGGSTGAVDWTATASISLSGTDDGLLLVLARDGTLREVLLDLGGAIGASAASGARPVPLGRAGLRIQAGPAIDLGASVSAGAAGPLAVSVVRTTHGVSTALGRPGAFLETELSLASPGGTLSGSATVRVDLAPRPPSLGDAARVVLSPGVVWVVVRGLIYAGTCLGSEGALCPAPVPGQGG